VNKKLAIYQNILKIHEHIDFAQHNIQISTVRLGIGLQQCTLNTSDNLSMCEKNSQLKSAHDTNSG